MHSGILENNLVKFGEMKNIRHISIQQINLDYSYFKGMKGLLADILAQDIHASSHYAHHDDDNHHHHCLSVESI